MRNTAAIRREIEDGFYKFSEHFNPSDYLDGTEEADEMESILEGAINEADIVYYASAIEFLAEHDNSLRESLAIAGEMGYEPENLNSEILACLLLQDKLRDILQRIYFQGIIDENTKEEEEEKEEGEEEV